MKKLSYVLATLLVAVTSTLQAQTFPLTVKAYWNPNPVGDAVTSYTIVLDGGTPISVGTVVINDANCTLTQYPQGCIMAPLTIPAAGQHTFVVTATNAWATSAPLTVTVQISSPGQIVWIKVAK